MGFVNDSSSPGRLEIGERAYLQNVFLHVTKACNLHCSYCYCSASQPLPDELRTEELMRLWPDLLALRPRKVILTGGEPLLRPDILDLLRGLQAADPQHHVLRCLNTNGYNVTSELAWELVGLADEARVSLDGLRERNDAVRGAGSFDAAIQALETFYAVGFEPKVLVTVTAMSAPNLEELLCFLFERKLTRINLNGFRPIGRGYGHVEWQADTEAVQAAVRRAYARCYPGRPSPSPPPERPVNAGPWNCGVGRYLNIMPNGDVFPCHVLTQREFRLGNVREQSLLDICRQNGLLGQLAALDFRELAQQETALAELGPRPICMGPVYARTRDLPIWRRHLPALPIPEPRRASAFKHP